MKNLRVFLASPGGVEPERQAVRRLVEEVNVPFRRHGWQVEVLGWEDRGPASGRAQADINQDVERCDVFLGIVWDRWGTPTGEHASGFAEEWALAKTRGESTQEPELWLCFKDVDEERLQEPDDQLAQVVEFRDAIERAEIAFYKTFRSPVELEVAVRRTLLDELLKRTDVGREAVRAIRIDWSSALAHEPASLLPDGQERERLATELLEPDPVSAAGMLSDLASELDDPGYSDVADRYHERAASALHDAGRDHEALFLWRRLLLKAIEVGHPTEVTFAVRQLSEWLPPEQHWEASAWTACIEWPIDKEDRAQRDLQTALTSPVASELEDEVLHLWRRTLWELWLNGGSPELVISDAGEIAQQESENLTDNLALLHAEALAAVADPSANDAWQQLRRRSLESAEADPARSARLSARWAVHLTHQHEWAAAEEGFVRAATLWARTSGYEEESAECFFSAQSVGRLSGEWIPKGWSWRPVAASLRGSPSAPAAKAATHERRGVLAHVARNHSEARQHLSLALAIHRRAGHLRGALRVTRMLADLDKDAGDLVDAALGYCMCGDGREAAKAAPLAAARELTERLPLGRTEWMTRAACAVLAHIGRHATEERAAAMLPSVLALSRGPGTALRSVETEAAEALCQLSLALNDADAALAVDRLAELLTTENYNLERPAGEGVRMLTDVRRVDAADALVAQFVRSPSRSSVSPGWVADHLDTPARLAAVRGRALGGDPRAMLSMALAERIDGDSELEGSCAAYCAHVISSNLGHTPDGGIWGLMALDITGALAAHCRLVDPRRQVADMLLLYALETHWPMVNRVSAVHGFGAVARTLDEASRVDALRPLADPVSDLDAEPGHGLDGWVKPGELQGSAVAVAVRLCPSGAVPTWLHEAILRARVDERSALRAFSWDAARVSHDVEVNSSLELALADPDVDVRLAALHCWRERCPGLPPAHLLDRLVIDPFTSVRVAVVEMSASCGAEESSEHVRALLEDTDAYVRRLAGVRLSGPLSG